jgi:hypothetical protein
MGAFDDESFMTDSKRVLIDWLRAEFAAEQSADFARLKRIPDTSIVRFLDTFVQLSPHEQSEVVDILTDWSSYGFLDQLPPPALVERFSQLTCPRSFAEGVRYTGVNLLAGLAKTGENGCLAGWLKSQGITGLATQPPEYLASGIADLQPVRIPTLRRLVQRAFATRFAAESQDIGSEFWRYQGKLNETALRVEIRYSGRMGRPQLQYDVQVENPNMGYRLAGITFERVLGVGFGWWDYLTVENAERSVALLCDLVEYAAQLPQRLPLRSNTKPNTTATIG